MCLTSQINVIKWIKRRWKHSVQVQVPLNCNRFDTFACCILRNAATEFPWSSAKGEDPSTEPSGGWSAYPYKNVLSSSAGTGLSWHGAQTALVAEFTKLQKKNRIPSGVTVKDMTHMLVEQSKKIKNIYSSESAALTARTWRLWWCRCQAPLVVRGEHHRHEDERYWIGSQEVCELTGGQPFLFFQHPKIIGSDHQGSAMCREPEQRSRRRQP